MSHKKLGSLDVECTIGGLLINFEEVSLSIEDASKVTYQKGVPNGSVRGRVSASGEITVNSHNLTLLLAVAETDGSFMDMQAFDIAFTAATARAALNIIAFGCKLKITDLLSASESSDDELMHKLPFDVTSPDFIKINGTSYVGDGWLEKLIGFDAEL